MEILKYVTREQEVIMRQFLFILMFSWAITLQGQIQVEKESIFDQLKTNVILISEGELIEDEKNTRAFISEFLSHHKEKYNYTRNFSVMVTPQLEYEIGEIQSKSILYSVMFIKTVQDRSSPLIEFMVIYKKENPSNETSTLDILRNKWMELCNTHQANNLVRQLYTEDAIYYNRGRLLQGSQALSAEYSYMNSPGYSLKLTPKHVVFVSSEIAYEIGQCSGSYPYPYMLLWEKQEDGNWKVRMDSNY